MDLTVGQLVQVKILSGRRSVSPTLLAPTRRTLSRVEEVRGKDDRRPLGRSTAISVRYIGRTHAEVSGIASAPTLSAPPAAGPTAVGVLTGAAVARRRCRPHAVSGPFRRSANSTVTCLYSAAGAARLGAPQGWQSCAVSSSSVRHVRRDMACVIGAARFT
jgi:hypothetical protein